MEQDLRSDLTRTVLAVLVIGGLIAGSLWILRPFLAATIWATMIVVTTWPILRMLQAHLWGKRWLAATVMTVALLLVFVIPLSAAVGTIVANAGEIVAWANRLSDVKLPWNPAEKTPGVFDALQKVAKDYEGTKAAERALLTSAGVLFTEKKYADAEAQFAQLTRAYPDTVWAAEATLGVASSLDAQGKTPEAISKYEEIRRRFASSAIIDDAKLALARLYEEQKPEDAYKLYDERAKSGPGTRLAITLRLR